MPLSSTSKIVWILLLFLFLFANRINGQLKEPVQISLLQSDTDHHTSSNFRIDKESLAILMKSRPAIIQTELMNRANRLIPVALTRSIIRKNNISDHIFYTGKLMEDERSLVSLTLTKDQIRGFISDAEGNYSIQTKKDGLLMVKNAKAISTSEWTCHTEMTNDFYQNNKNLPQYKSAQSDTISIYFECDYSLFELHAFSVAATESYVYNLFNQVQAIYAQEGISMVIEDIKVWEEPDPYDQNSVESALLDFRNHLGQDYAGTFAHLLSGNEQVNGGLAFINGLCDRQRSYAYSNLDLFLDPNGDYSWDVHVVAHEIGHNLGSPHTHDCAWGPSGEDAIDACGAPSPECENAPIPPQGGTIMSYCHTAPVGINFSLGFGPEPGDLIRNMISFCRQEEGDVCITAHSIFENGTHQTGPLEKGSGATHLPATHAKWYTFTAPQDGSVNIESCGQGVDTRLYLYRGTCYDLDEVQSSDDDCFSGGGFNYAATVNDFSMLQGTTIYFEWDDRWSNEAFYFTFSFVPDPLPHCENGIQDLDETGIDCGGSCTPCPPVPCQDETDLPELIEAPIFYSSMESIDYNGYLTTTADLDIRSGQAIVFDAGFILQKGGLLKAIIEDCEEE